MKNKVFLGMAGLVLLFVFLMAGCVEIPSDYTNTTKLNAIPGPANLTANNSYEGMVILTWSAVKDAVSYQIYRYDTVNKVTVRLATDYPDLYYVDYVNWNNQLRDNQNYDYIVISESGYTGTGTAGFVDIIQNGESKVSNIRPKVPSTFTPTLTDADISITEYNDFAILVKIANKANLNYRVAYTYGTDQTIVRELRANEQGTTGNWFDPYRTVIFPKIGGTNTISVEATFYGGTYYAGSFPVTKTQMLEESPTLAAVDNFSATRRVGQTLLRWDNVSGATGYNIYKAQVSNTNGYYPNPNQGSTDYPTANAGITVLGDWSVVEATQYRVATNTTTENRWEALENTGADTGFYIYAIIAKSDNAKSLPAYDWAGEASVDRPGLVLVQKAKPNDYTFPVELSWDDHDIWADFYTLEYAQVKSIYAGEEADYGSYEQISNYYPIEVTQDDFFQNRAVKVIYFSRDDIGKNYIFKLTATKNDITSSASYHLLNTGAFQTQVSFFITRDNTRTNVDANKLFLVVNDGSSFRDGRDYTFKLYRRVYTPAQQNVYIDLTPTPLYYSAATENGKLIYEDGGLNVTLQYQYKLVTVGFEDNYYEDEFVPYGRDALISSVGTYYPDEGGTTWVGDVKYPEKATLLNIAGNRNIGGLTITLQYVSVGGGTRQLEMTINRLYNGNADDPQYVYYIFKPSDAAASQQLRVKYPWSNQFDYLDYSPGNWNL
jgi:hypothetical protein